MDVNVKHTWTCSCNYIKDSPGKLNVFDSGWDILSCKIILYLPTTYTCTDRIMNGTFRNIATTITYRGRPLIIWGVGMVWISTNFFFRRPSERFFFLGDPLNVFFFFKFLAKLTEKLIFYNRQLRKLNFLFVRRVQTDFFFTTPSPR